MTAHPTTSRRTFLGSSALAGAAAGSVPYFAWSQPAFANRAATDRPGIGCIGVAGMGTGDARGHAGFGDILAVCDVDTRHAERAHNDEKIGKGKADAYGDYGKVLERPDIDVVSIVTPDHWHAKIAIEALEAGKHVFCQKPLTLTIEKNKLIRAACERHRHRYHAVFAPNHKLRRAVTALAIGNIGKRCDTGAGGHAGQELGRTRDFPKGGDFPGPPARRTERGTHMTSAWPPA